MRRDGRDPRAIITERHSPAQRRRPHGAAVAGGPDHSRRGRAAARCLHAAKHRVPPRLEERLELRRRASDAWRASGRAPTFGNRVARTGGETALDTARPRRTPLSADAPRFCPAAEREWLHGSGHATASGEQQWEALQCYFRTADDAEAYSQGRARRPLAALLGDPGARAAGALAHAAPPRTSNPLVAADPDALACGGEVCDACTHGPPHVAARAAEVV